MSLRPMWAGREGTIFRLLGGMVHEVKNVLNVMSLHLQALTDRVDRAGSVDQSENVARHLRSLREQIVRLDRLVSRFGEVVSGRSTSSEEIDLVAVAADAVALCTHEARKRHVELRMVAPPGILGAVNRQAFEWLLIELFVDAIDRVAARRPSPEGVAHPPAVEVWVSTGLEGVLISIECPGVAGDDLPTTWQDLIDRLGVAATVEREAGRTHLRLTSKPTS